jgi:hypothetical protein
MAAAARPPRAAAANSAPVAAATGSPPLPPLPAGKPLALPQLLRFERKGHVATRKLLTPAEAAPYAATLSDALASRRLDAFRHRVSVLCPPDAARAARISSVDDARRMLREHGAEDVGFLQARCLREGRACLPRGVPLTALCPPQVFNLHREDSAVGAAARALVVRSPLSWRIASALPLTALPSRPTR